MSSTPEFLDGHDGRPLRPRGPSRRGRRTALLAGGLVGVAAVAAGGAWAWSFLATGPQPAVALPGSTIAYASIDLDPGGGQKVEALRTLRKFPAFEDHIGLDTDDDVRRYLFEQAQDSGACPGVDYDRDVEPWLGNRLAVAAVDTGADEPASVLVVQVTDEAAAEDGLATLADCGAGESDGWVVSDGWALVGESQDLVDGIAADAEDAALSDDEDYTSWVEKAGDAGIASFYVAPGAGDFLADEFGQVEGSSGDGDEPPAALKDFGGMAGTLRFDDGGLELDVAADAGGAQGLLGRSDRGDDVLATLPDDTVAAIGVGFADGWFTDVLDRFGAVSGMSTDQLLDELSAESGLDLPGDAETLAGDSAALAVGGDFDPEAFFGAGDVSEVPIGVKVRGDADAIEAVLDKIRSQAGADAELLGSDHEDGTVAIGPSADYRASLLRDGDLGGSQVFRNVVPQAGDAAAILFVNFDASGGWLDDLAGEDAEAARNLEPLEGFGVSGWLDGDTSHVQLRVTTD